MKCPRCVQNVTPGAESCPHCGYSIAVARGFYGEGGVVAQQLMDVESRLTEAERQQIRTLFAQFTEQFPQLFLLLYLGALPPPASPRQFAFWLLNHAAVQEVDAWQPNERGLLLVVDPDAGSAVLAMGYFLEPFVQQAELDAVLRSVQKELGRGDYPAALEGMMAALGDLLRKKAKQAERNPEAFRPAPDPLTAFPRLVRTGEAVSVPSSSPVAGGETPAAPGARDAAPPAGASTPPSLEVSPAASAKKVRHLKQPATRRNPTRRS